MVGRIVRARWAGVQGTVTAWEPLGASMTDVRLETASGLMWVSSTDLEPTDGLGALPSRTSARHEADREALESLQIIRERLVADIRPGGERWLGCEYGKALVGRGIDGAIAEIKARNS